MKGQATDTVVVLLSSIVCFFYTGLEFPLRHSLCGVLTAFRVFVFFSKAAVMCVGVRVSARTPHIAVFQLTQALRVMGGGGGADLNRVAEGT